VLYEVMNMAALWKLPVVYVCENNLYNEYTHFSETTAGEIGARAQAFGIPSDDVDGQDVAAVHTAATRAVARARAGEGPSFLVCHTYRFRGHHVGDVDRAYYRTKAEEQQWEGERDPIRLLAARLVSAGHADEEKLAGLDETIDAEIARAAEHAVAAPYPDPDEVDEDVYA
jgi:TPP-dependent pyruvate/acetoin dehydrogenase alpha subunit